MCLYNNGYNTERNRHSGLNISILQGMLFERPYLSYIFPSLHKMILVRSTHRKNIFQYTITWYRLLRAEQAGPGSKASDCIRELPASNLSQDTDFLDWGFTWFFSVPQLKFRGSILKYVMTAYFHILYNSSFSNEPTTSLSCRQRR
jgi:hypothetical protein